MSGSAYISGDVVYGDTIHGDKVGGDVVHGDKYVAVKPTPRFGGHLTPLDCYPYLRILDNGYVCKICGTEYISEV